MTHHYTILHGGTILTFEDALPSDAGTRALGRPDLPDAAGRRASAICYAHERILAVGDDREILALAGPDSTVVDLHGRAVLPGFIDGHAHPLWEGLVAGRPSLEGTADVRDAMRRLAGLGEHLPPDAWLVARFEHGAWAEPRQPGRDRLDRAIPDRPVVLVHASGHGVVANSLALALAGITATSGDGDASAVVERDAHGEPTGLIDGPGAWARIALAMPRPDDAELAAAIARAGAALGRDGVTTIADADVGGSLDLESELAAWGAAVAGGRFPVRLELLPGLVRLAGPADRDPPPPAEVAAALPAEARPAIRLDRAKLVADGALTMRTAWLREPYASDPTTHGAPAHPPDELAERVLRAAAAGWAVATHAIGDAAIAATLDAFGRAGASLPRGPRHRIDHAMLLPTELLDRLAASGVPVLLQPQFVAWAGDAYRSSLGHERAADLNRYASLLAAGVPFGFSSDRPGPVVGGSPLDGVRSAVRHAGPSGVCLAPGERPSIPEGLHAWTAGPADILGDGAEAGRLATGLRADLVVLSADPTAVPADAWARGEDGISVLAAIVGGTVISGSLEAVP